MKELSYLTCRFSVHLETFYHVYVFRPALQYQAMRMGPSLFQQYHQALQFPKSCDLWLPTENDVYHQSISPTLPRFFTWDIILVLPSSVLPTSVSTSSRRKHSFFSSSCQLNGRLVNWVIQDVSWILPSSPLKLGTQGTQISAFSPNHTRACSAFEFLNWVWIAKRHFIFERQTWNSLIGY